MSFGIQDRKEFESEEGSKKKGVCECCRSVYHFFTADSLLGAITNLCNATIGVGILFLPSVIRSTGFFVGFTLMMLGGLVESITLYLLYKSYDKLRKIDPSIKDYEQIGKYCFGSNNILGYFMSYLIQLTIFILNLGGTISFSIIISDSLQFIRNEHPYIHALVLAVILLIATFISMFPKIASLRFTSYLSMIVYVVFLILVIVSYFTKSTTSFGEYQSWPTDVFSVISTLGVIIFSFSCHTILCPIVSQFREENQWKVGSFGVFGSILVDYMFYSLIALFGYLCFVDYTEGDLILSFGKFGNNPVISSVLTGLMALSVFASYPLCIYVARYTVNNLIFDVYGDISNCVCQSEIIIEDDSIPSPVSLLILSKEDEEVERKKMELEKEKIVGVKSKNFCASKSDRNCVGDFSLTIVSSIIITGISYLFALFYPKANVVFGLVGSTGAIFTVYIFPCLFYLIIYHKDMRLCDLRRLGVVLIAVLGSLFGVFVTVSSIINLIEGKS